MHYHVSRHSNDDDPAIVTDVYEALDYIGDELRDMSEFEYEGAHFIASEVSKENPYRESDIPVDTMRDALRSFVKADHYSALSLNALGVASQHRAEKSDRAPLFRGEDGDEKLAETADHVLSEVINNTYISVWECANPECTEEEN